MPSRNNNSSIRSRLGTFLPPFLALAAITTLLVTTWHLAPASAADEIITHPLPGRRRHSHLDKGLLSALQNLHDAVATLQELYFDTFLGTWPRCIDWTAAVIGTHVAGSLYSLTRSVAYSFALERHVRRGAGVSTASDDIARNYEAGQQGRVENSIGGYFADTISYYYGQDAFALRQQANDDMLWVVLGWLDTVRFIDMHNREHYAPAHDRWWGTKYTAAFAHRARIFYDLAERGWDERDCGGGMIWNPHLVPYKNAITNELYISASVAMYLYFPGDNNTSPFTTPENYNSDALCFGDASDSAKCRDNMDQPRDRERPIDVSRAPGHDARYLKAAIKAYDWLQDSGMRNDQGLYIDGFHISRREVSKPGVCDQRNTMVYTYNQGVVLSGQRGLWESTGDTRYLSDGHQLIRDVIAATCFDLDTDQQSSEQQNSDTRTESSDWCGLGRDGILEDHCDALGICSQDAQNFKGIFFHHLTLFCDSLPREPTVPGKTHTADDALWTWHRQNCERYSRWVTGNAVGALNSRDTKGRFGGWWNRATQQDEVERTVRPLDENADDYRNLGLRNETKWGLSNGRLSSAVGADQQTLRVGARDLNDRGRGRTVETQGAGVAVVRAMWEFAFERFTNPGYDAASSPEALSAELR